MLRLAAASDRAVHVDDLPDHVDHAVDRLAALGREGDLACERQVVLVDDERVAEALVKGAAHALVVALDQVEEAARLLGSLEGLLDLLREHAHLLLEDEERRYAELVLP